MILVIDNYDSFTFNLVQYLGELGLKTQIYRNDKISIKEIIQKDLTGIVISPGPCTPKEAGMQLIRTVRRHGKLVHEPYDKPKRPPWSPIYSIKKRFISRSWEIFLRDLISDMYWDIELEE